MPDRMPDRPEYPPPLASAAAIDVQHDVQSDVQSGMRTDVPPLTNAELVQLQIRVIALENVVIALLATASDHQLALARAMAGHIFPRPGFTFHRLTVHAAAEMISLVERAERFRIVPPAS